MRALVAVDQLRDAQVPRQRAQHVGLVARQVGAQAGLTISRTACLAASSRSSSRPMDISWVALSANGNVTCRSLRSVRRKVPDRPISSAVMHTSPSPCMP